MALTSAFKLGGLYGLDTKFMVKDEDLCVVSPLDEYSKRREKWRRVNNEIQILLSYIQPYNQAVPSAISGWIKNVLKSSGVNVFLFTGHSTRSVISSKASASYLSVIQNLECGT